MRPQNVGHTACPATGPEPQTSAQTQAEAMNHDTGAAPKPTSSGGRGRVWGKRRQRGVPRLHKPDNGKNTARR